MKKTTLIIITISLIIILIGCQNGKSVDVAPAYFYNTDDFITFVKTNSRNREDYKDLKHPYIFPLHNMDEKEFLDIEKVFPVSEEFMENLDYILIYNDGEYSPYFYNFYEGKITITIKYDIERYSSKSIVKYYNTINNSESNLPAYTEIALSEAINTKLDENVFIRKNIGDYTVAYKVHYSINDNAFFGYSMNAFIDGFNITITVASPHVDYNYDKLISDPLNAPIAVFFTDGEKRDEAFLNLVKAIENREVLKDK